MNNRIRVAHLITNFVVGGAQDYLLLIVRGLDRTRFQPIVAGRLVGEWVPVVKSLDGVEIYDIPSLRQPISPINDLKCVFEIKKFCRDRRVHILHTHSSKPGVVGRLAGRLAGVRAVVHTVHGFSFNSFMPPLERLFYVSIERYMSRFTTTLLLISHGDRETATTLGIGARQSVETFYYGVDYAPFQRSLNRTEIRSSLGFHDQNRVIGFTGRFSNQKGLHILVEAFARVLGQFPQARLLLVGDGHLRPKIEEQIEMLGLKQSVVITGFRSDIPAMLAAMDVFVMTSLWEGLSRSLAEAMYARLPVIATDVGGTSDAVQSDHRGWLIRPNSVDAATEALVDAMSNPTKARSYAEAGYSWARQTFDPKRMQQRMAALYEELASNRV
jgi:glycosyltransferase involved in cell wall biosynthesis